MKEEACQLLEKGERALRAAEILLQAGDPEFAAGRAYYAMLHAAQARLRQQDLQYHRHTGVHSAFGQHYAKTGVLDPKYHRWLLDAFDERIRGDYGVQATFEVECVAAWVEQAREFLREARRFLESAA